LIEGGKAVVKALCAERFPVSAAFWMSEAASPQWMLVLATPNVAAEGLIKSYEKVLKHAKSPRTVYWPSLIQLEKPTGWLVKAVRDSVRSEYGTGYEGFAEVNLLTSDYAPLQLYVYKVPERSPIRS
jgi:hypothetical protein